MNKPNIFNIPLLKAEFMFSGVGETRGVEALQILVRAAA